jgi:hypothetical protein
VDQEVAKTLGELELKLRELERELASIGAGSGPSSEPEVRIVDEAIESPSDAPGAPQQAAAPPPPPPAPSPPPHSAGGPPVAPSRAAPSPLPPPVAAPRVPPPFSPPPSTRPPAAPPAFEPREAIEQRFSLEARETVYGEIPATKDRRETIDVDELVRFGETLKRTFGELIDRYTRLLASDASRAPESHTESHG